ncbi:hypothetical protein PLESTM_000862900 [Pleodorina starrii]|nr:hypothetical protein PLESTM_000862900 [Pleodorina starrii]
MLPLFGLEVALVAMLAGVLMMPAKRKLSDQLVELQKVYTDLQAQLTAIERSDDYQKAASLLAADPGARANKKKFTAAVSSAYDTCVALKNQMASVSANIAQLEMAMEQPALKVLVSDKSGRVMERPFKDLDYVNDSWVNKAGKEHKALKRENRELNQIYHAFQKVNRSLEDEREARRDDAPPEQMEELEKATNDAITDDWAESREGGDVVQGAAPPAASGNINVNASWWLSVCSSSWTKQWVQQGFPLWWKQAGVTPPPKVMRNHQGALEQRAFVTESVEALLAAGAVRQVSARPRVVNPLNAIPKPRQPGKFRLLLDLRYVNQYVYCPKFKFEKLTDLEQIFQPNDLLISADLTNSYWQLRMREDACDYLGFEWDGRFYVFTVLPFGLVSAPWAFSKLMREFSAYLRGKGFRLINYLDDFLFLLGPDRATASKRRDEIVREFERAGVALNKEKSVLSPTSVVRCLGYLVDSAKGVFAIPQDRWESFQRAVDEALARPSIPARTLARVVGHAVSMYVVIGRLGRLFTRASTALLPDRWGWSSEVTVTPAVREELRFWQSLDRERLTSPIRRPPEVNTLEVNTDASATGWAGVVSGPGLRTVHPVARGYLSGDMRRTSSGNRELAAIFFSLESLKDELNGRRVHLLTDSQNAERIVDHGSRKAHLQEWALKIFWWCKEHQVQLSVSWIPRELNEVADYFSKLKDGDDWKLNPVWFGVLDRKWGPHTVDRFASAGNAQLKRFNSLYRCPGAEAVNCFSQMWGKENNWCNPPFALVGRVLEFMKSQAATGTVVLPVWKSAVWWPVLCPREGEFAQCVTACVELPHQQRDLFLPGETAANEYGVGAPRWRVWAVRVSFEGRWRWRAPLATPCK